MPISSRKNMLAMLCSKHQHQLGHCELATSLLRSDSEACFQLIILHQILSKKTSVWCYRNHVESALQGKHTDIQLEKYACNALPKASASVLAIVSLSLHYSAQRHVFNSSSCIRSFQDRQVSDAVENDMGAKGRCQKKSVFFLGLCPK